MHERSEAFEVLRLMLAQLRRVDPDAVRVRGYVEGEPACGYERLMRDAVERAWRDVGRRMRG